MMGHSSSGHSERQLKRLQGTITAMYPSPRGPLRRVRRADVAFGKLRRRWKLVRISRQKAHVNLSSGFESDALGTEVENVDDAIIIGSLCERYELRILHVEIFHCFAILLNLVIQQSQSLY